MNDLPRVGAPESEARPVVEPVRPVDRKSSVLTNAPPSHTDSIELIFTALVYAHEVQT